MNRPVAASMSADPYKTRRIAVIILILFIGIAYSFLTSMVIFRGDDMAYSGGLGLYMDVTGRPAWRYPLSHIMNVNGRLGDTFNFLFLDFLPRPLLDILCGIFVGAFYWIILRLCFPESRVNLFADIAVIGAITFGLTWWNAFLMLVIQINYIWTSVLNLSCVLILIHKRLRCWQANALIPLFFIAPAFHEACGLPLVVAIALYAWIPSGRHNFTPLQRRLFFSYICGSVIPLCSPMLYSRLLGVTDNFPADDPMWLILLKSDYLVILLVIFIAILFCNHRLHREIIHSDILIWVVAAIGSACFSAISGVQGRSGWFAQVFALIGIVRSLSLFSWKISKPISIVAGSVVAIAIISHFISFLVIQHRYYFATEKVIVEYRSNPSSPVFQSYLPFADAPWWILNKHLGLIEASDEYSLDMEKLYGANSDARLVMLPPELRDIDLSTASLPLVTTEGILIANPGNTMEIKVVRQPDGGEKVYTPFHIRGKSFYFVRPRDLMPGER